MKQFLFFKLVALGICISMLSFFTKEEASGQTADSLLIDHQTEEAISDGLDFLAKELSEQGAFQRGPYKENVAIVSLSGLAFMSEGSLPGQGKYSRPMKRCLKFILSKCKPNGFITASNSQSHGPMYGHGFATMFLAEMYGVSPTPSLRKKLENAVSLIIDTQNKEGGWRYLPQQDDADISVSICQIMALRAARNAGIYVPNSTIEACVQYIKKSQNADGGFMYLLNGGESAFPRTAAGVVALHSAGIYDGPEIEGGLKYLMAHIPTQKKRMRESHYFYGHYYATQAMWQAGGNYWEQWYPAIRDDLLQLQQADGSWNDGVSTEYGTAMSCIILQMPNNYLPIFQR